MTENDPALTTLDLSELSPKIQSFLAFILQSRANYENGDANRDATAFCARHIWRILSNELCGWAFQEAALGAPPEISMDSAEHRRHAIYLALTEGRIDSPDHSLAVIPRNLAQELADSLISVEKGEITELFLPPPKAVRKKWKYTSAHSLRKLRHQAVMFCAAMEGKGLSADESENYVAERFGVPATTLREWKKGRSASKPTPETTWLYRIGGALAAGKTMDDAIAAWPRPLGSDLELAAQDPAFLGHYRRDDFLQMISTKQIEVSGRAYLEELNHQEAIAEQRKSAL